ncbi:MAG: hypothetical protein HFH86_01180 [Bacilli bacterium]|jgi:hypothetical protein|nr:hypothetical protein [Bacilli bacterium]
MQKKYTITLYILIIIMIGTIGIGLGYLSFNPIEEEKENAYVYVDGNLSFNFLEGNNINTKETKKNYSFSITNTSSDTYYYNISLNDVVGGTNSEFIVESNREGFQTITKKYPEKETIIAQTIKINGNETHNYTLQLNNPNQSTIKGKINVEIEKDMNNFGNIILKNNIVNSTSKTKISEEIATEEEGLIESTDDLGTSYYFRGNISNNYVKFAGFNWRIVKINGDGSVKIILDDLINNNTQFYQKDYNLNFESSNIYQNLVAWYQTHLKEYDNIIANYKFCTDATTDERGYKTLTRIYIDHDPIFHCIGDTSTLKIGLLTADEVAFAGGTNQINNQKYYLYQPNIKGGWWTMSPANNKDNQYSFVEMNQFGKLNDGTTGTLFRGSRPVINLVRKSSASGTGTQQDPYIVNNV